MLPSSRSWTPTDFSKPTGKCCKFRNELKKKFCNVSISLTLLINMWYDFFPPNTNKHQICFKINSFVNKNGLRNLTLSSSKTVLWLKAPSTSPACNSASLVLAKLPMPVKPPVGSLLVACCIHPACQAKSPDSILGDL